VREVKFKYLWQHNETGRFVEDTWDIFQIECGLNDYDYNYRRAYTFVARRQYTSIKDVTGEEIYEGDIVECDMVYRGGKLPHIGEIVYSQIYGAFATKNEAGVTLLHNHYLSTFKILGNIYENPELLK